MPALTFGGRYSACAGTVQCGVKADRRSVFVGAKPLAWGRPMRAAFALTNGGPGGQWAVRRRS
jgi:hypothetical protein